MAYCGNCGTQSADGTNYCPKCGTSMGKHAFKDYFYNNANDGDFDKTDVEKNKVMGIFSYLGILCLIPILAAPNSKYVRFHANQGLVLAIIEIAYSIILFIVGAVLGLILLPLSIFDGHWTVYSSIMSIFSLPWLFFVALIIVGIVNAVNGVKKELPLIGKIRLLG